MEKILTISIAAYNAEKDIERCLESMLNTDVAEFLDIVVVNDGSKDNTVAVAQKYVNGFPHIVRLIDKENGGHGSTINASLQVARGKYYKIVDSDDWVDKEGIERLVAELQETDVDLILNPYHTIDAITRKATNMVVPFEEGQPLKVIQSMEDTSRITIYMHSVTFKTSLVQKMGPIISEKCFYVDMEYTIFPLPFAKNYICFDFPVYQYLLGTATQSMNMKNLVNRRDQHLHVTKRIISFYHDNKEQMLPNIRAMILHRVKLAALSQYKIYFNMEPRDSKQEIVDFDKWLKATDPDVYEGAEGRFMKIVKMNRLAGFSVYGICVNCLKKFQQMPQV